MTDRKPTLLFDDDGNLVGTEYYRKTRPNREVMVTFPRHQLERDILLWAQSAGVTAPSIIRRIVSIKLGLKPTALIPGKYRDTTRGHIRVKFPKVVLDKLGYYARDKRLSLSAAVRELLRKR